MSNLALRVLSAVVALPLLIALIAWRQPWGWGACVLAAALVSTWELLAMAQPSWTARRRLGVVAVAAALWTGLYMRPDLAVVWFPAAMVVCSVLVLVQPGDIPQAAARWGMVTMAAVYVVGLSVTLALLHRDVTDGRRWVFCALAVTFANDTGAYFAGRAFGRHKLYPRVSPGKTVEGAVGGLVAAAGAMVAARATFFPALSPMDVVAIAVPASVLGPAGDLVESLIKRSAGAKDSGRLIPGHGGMWDRIDALLFVGAWVFAYARYVR